MEWYWLLSFVAIGMGAGFLSGLIGISGGIVTVPSLLAVFRSMGMPDDVVMHIAIGTSLSAMTFNSFSSMMAHNRRESVIWEAVLKMLPGLLLGVGVGALIADHLSSSFLQRFFGIFELAIGLYFLFPMKAKDGEIIPSWYVMSGAMFLISGISSMLGIGGGLMVTPLLIFLGFHMRKSVGTASATSFFVCLIGAIGYLALGLTSGTDIEDCIGFIHFPAFLSIMLIAPFSAILGAHLAHELPVKYLKRFFGIALMIAGLILLI